MVSGPVVMSGYPVMPEFSVLHVQASTCRPAVNSMVSGPGFALAWSSSVLNDPAPPHRFVSVTVYVAADAGVEAVTTATAERPPAATKVHVASVASR